jgi:hypothetical protein
MKTTMRLSFAVAVALLSGCSSGSSGNPSPGDVAPKQTFAAAPRAVVRGLAQVSMPQSSKDVFVPKIDLPSAVESDAIVNVPAGAPGRYVLAVDSVAADAFLYLVVSASTEDEMNAALADIVVTSPDGKVLNAVAAPRHTSQGVSAPAPKPSPAIPLAGQVAGEYVITVGATAARFPLTIKAQQPSSAITLTAAATTSELLLGNDAEVDVRLTEAAATVPAHVVGHLVDPAMNAGPDVVFTTQGDGVYRATGLGSAFTATSAPGVWHVFVEADGKTPGGTSFHRFASTAFDFAVPTARITDASTTRVVRDDLGTITAFEVDVAVESKATDRYEVSALLTATGPDGQEHPLVRSETADVLDPGTGTLTLRFEAGHAKLSGLEGEFQVRDLMLYSQGMNSTLQRTLAGNGRHFPAVRVAELATARDLPPRVYEMQRNGLL